MAIYNTMHHYNTFGLREHWLSKFLANARAFFSNDEHGLNPKTQIPVLKHWLQEAGIITLPECNLTKTGETLAKKYNFARNAAWEIIWIALTYESKVAEWYSKDIPFNQQLTLQELKARITTHPQNENLCGRTLQNALAALRNTFKESPLGNAIPIGVTTGRTHLVRKPAATLSPAAAAYSLYRHAEKNHWHNLTVSEFYQKDGVHQQFGLPRPTFETILRTLTEEHHHVLHAELNFGLDNIILRKDIQADDIPSMLL